MKRILLIVGVLVLVLVVGAVIFLFTGLNGAIKAVVESVGSRATGTPVTLTLADVSLSSGSGRLKGLVVGNPKGYATSSAFELGDIQIVLDTSTVMSDVVVIKSVVIEAPQVTYEVGPGGSNVGIIQANVDALRKSFGGGDDPKKPERTGQDGEKADRKADAKTAGRRFIIKDLQMRAGRVDVSATVLGGRKIGATLGAIHLTDIGTAEGGATTAEIATRILSALSETSIDSVKSLSIPELKASYESVRKLGDTLKGLFGK